MYGGSNNHIETSDAHSKSNCNELINKSTNRTRVSERSHGSHAGRLLRTEAGRWPHTCPGPSRPRRDQHRRHEASCSSLHKTPKEPSEAWRCLSEAALTGVIPPRPRGRSDSKDRSPVSRSPAHHFRWRLRGPAGAEWEAPPPVRTGHRARLRLCGHRPKGDVRDLTHVPEEGPKNLPDSGGIAVSSWAKARSAVPERPSGLRSVWPPLLLPLRPSSRPLRTPRPASRGR